MTCKAACSRRTRLLGGRPEIFEGDWSCRGVDRNCCCWWNLMALWTKFAAVVEVHSSRKQTNGPGSGRDSRERETEGERLPQCRSTRTSPPIRQRKRKQLRKNLSAVFVQRRDRTGFAVSFFSGHLNNRTAETVLYLESSQKSSLSEKSSLRHR